MCVCAGWFQLVRKEILVLLVSVTTPYRNPFFPGLVNGELLVFFETTVAETVAGQILIRHKVTDCCYYMTFSCRYLCSRFYLDFRL